MGAAIAVVAAGAGAAPADAAGFLAGAARQDTTPPAAGSPEGAAADAAFASGFASLCPAPVFPMRGRFALQEPYAGSGDWQPPDPFCDANGNGRWDGLYADNGRGPLTGVNDSVDVRALALSDGAHRPVVYASVEQIGLFDVYTEQARADLAATYHVDADLVVSANHNESTPDSIGLYGAGQTPLGVGTRSGIDEYHMSWLADRIAHAAADAVRALRPARLYANQTATRVPDGTSGSTLPLLTGMSQRLSDQFPTTVALPADNRVAAVDPKLGVLQARGSDGTPIFTLMSIAAHNQEMGNAGTAVSGDWPGAFARAFDASHAGTSLFLVGDNGSIEDPQTQPPAIPGGSENHSSVALQYVQARATGERFAALVDDATRRAQPLTPGAVRLTRRQLCVPLENNGFVALAAAGDFGRRQGYACDASDNPVAPVPNGLAAPTASTRFRTFVSYADVGPDLQLVDNPGEAFPALIAGSPFGAEEASCNRPNPAVPAWHARALFRFQVGLADDLIGYLLPAWAFASGTPGLFNNDSCYQDMRGHRHKLESESVGPTGANAVADRLAALLDAEPDRSARIVEGRFVRPDGGYTRWPEGAAGIQLRDPGAAALGADGGTLIGAPATAGFGRRAVDASGVFMDFDGQPQASPDVTTRGMMVLDRRGCVRARYYLDVFPALGGAGLGRAVSGPPLLPARACPLSSINGVPELQRGAAERLGLRGAGCARGRAPRVTLARRTLAGRRGRVRVAGRARAFRCRARIARVTVTLVRRGRGSRRCRYLLPSGRLSARRRCGGAPALLARGTARWSLAARLHPGRYSLIVRAYDTLGRRGSTRVVSVRVR